MDTEGQDLRSLFNVRIPKIRHYLSKFFRKQFQIQQRISKENINNEIGSITCHCEIPVTG